MRDGNGDVSGSRRVGLWVLRYWSEVATEMRTFLFGTPSLGRLLLGCHHFFFRMHRSGNNEDEPVISLFVHFQVKKCPDKRATRRLREKSCNSAGLVQSATLGPVRGSSFWRESSRNPRSKKTCRRLEDYEKLDMTCRSGSSGTESDTAAKETFGCGSGSRQGRTSAFSKIISTRRDMQFPRVVLPKQAVYPHHHSPCIRSGRQRRGKRRERLKSRQEHAQRTIIKNSLFGRGGTCEDWHRGTECSLRRPDGRKRVAWTGSLQRQGTSSV